MISQKAQYRLKKIEELNIYSSQVEILEAAIDMLFEKIEAELQKKHGEEHFNEIREALAAQSL